MCEVLNINYNSPIIPEIIPEIDAPEAIAIPKT
jgi:hypothetical protein